MAETTAAVRLTLKDRGFVRTFQRTAQTVGQGARDMGAKLRSSMSRGVDGGMDALRAMGSQLKNVTGLVGGIAGGLGLAELAKGAIDAETQFRNLSFALEAGTGRAHDWLEVQARAKTVARQTGIQAEELGRAMDELFSGTGDAEFMNAALSTIGTTARATGDDVTALSKIAGTLNQKFGLSAQELPEAMAMVVSAAHAGGASIEDLADDFAEVGGKAKAMGATGTEGLQQMLGILNLAKQESGRFEQAMTAIPQIFDQILERTDKGVLKSGGKVPIEIGTVDAQGRPRSPSDILADIVMATQGNAAELGEFGFGGEGLQTIMALAKTFRAELDATGGDINAARDAIAKALNGAAGEAMAWSKIQEKAASNLDSTQGRVDRAIVKLQEAFTTPEMIGALTKLAEVLPPVADAMAKLLGFITDSPMTAGALGASAVFGRGAIGGMLAGGGAGGGGAAIGKAAAAQMAAQAASTGGLIARGFAAAPAIALAGASIGSVFEQLGKLKDEAGTYNPVEAARMGAQERERAREELTANAVRSGTRAIDEDYGTFGEGGFLGLGFGDTAPERYALRDVHGADGQITTERTQIANQDAQTGLADLVASIGRQVEQQQRGGKPNVTLPEVKVEIDPSRQAQQASQLARETAAGIARQELRVRVLNADEIRSAPSPTPGAAPRPGSAT